MENQSSLLIALYEEEKTILEVMIKECLEDFDGPDYLLANYHQRAIFQINRNLQILKNLEDSLFNQKEFALRRISRIEKELEENKSEHLKSYLTERLQREKAELEKLNSIPKLATSEEDKQILENTLADLINKKIKKFKLVFSKSKNLYLEFLSPKNKIKIILPHIKQHIEKCNLYESEVIAFQKIGFEIINGSRLEISFINEGEKTTYKLKFLLIKIIFKILYYTEHKNESYIEF